MTNLGKTKIDSQAAIKQSIFSHIFFCGVSTNQLLITTRITNQPQSKEKKEEDDNIVVVNATTDYHEGYIYLSR